MTQFQEAKDHRSESRDARNQKSSRAEEEAKAQRSKITEAETREVKEQNENMDVSENGAYPQVTTGFWGNHIIFRQSHTFSPCPADHH